MKKILIFYASYGGGHLSAAKSIFNCFKENYEDVEVQMIDCVKYINKVLDKISVTAYQEMARKAPWAWGKVYRSSGKGALSKISSTSNKMMSHKLNHLLQEWKPDIIINTHPFASQMCSYLKKKHKISSVLATVMTDYAPHNQWLVGSDYMDYYFVAHEGMKHALIEQGIPPEKVYATGIPLSNRFLQHYNKQEIADSFGLDLSKKIILFFGGGEMGLGKEKTVAVLDALAQNFEDIQIIAISGKNQKMKRAFEEIVSENHKTKDIHILEYTDKVPELMSIATLVITKPGGLTTTESLVSGLPIVIINPLPGQEVENAEFLENRQVAIWIQKEDDPKEVLTSLLRHPERLQEMKKNAKLLAKKYSTYDICKTLLGPCTKVESQKENDNFVE